MLISLYNFRFSRSHTATPTLTNNLALGQAGVNLLLRNCIESHLQFHGCNRCVCRLTGCCVITVLYFVLIGEFLAARDCIIVLATVGLAALF